MASELLGETAIALHRVAYTLDSLRTRLTVYGDRLFEVEQRTQPIEDLRQMIIGIGELRKDCSSELGADHEAVPALAEVADAMGDIVRTLDLLRDPASAPADAPSSPEDALDRVEEHRERFDTARERIMGPVRRS